MLKWCAYCQRFLGELAPYERLELSHGICSPCSAHGLAFEPHNESRIQSLLHFQKRLWDLAVQGDFSQSDSILTESDELKIRPVDLLLGFVIPLIAHSSVLFNKQKLSEQDFDNLNSFCQSVIVKARNRIQSKIQRSVKPDVLLLTSLGNEHVLGLQALELWLQGEGIYAFSVPTGTSANDLENLLKFHQPKVVGFSISMKEQVSDISLMVKKVKELSPKVPPLLLAGGYAVKTGQINFEDLPGVALVKEESKLFLTIKTHLSMAFLYDFKMRVSS